MGFRPALRTSAKPLIGFYAQSGAGKTFSGLLVARGYVGPTGKIGMIETEAGRGEAYGDAREYPEIGGYEVLSLRDDFSPTKYGEAIKEAEKAKFDALLIDSGSAEWEGPGGVLAMAAANDAAGKRGVLIWQQPKIQHKREFMLRLMQTPIPLVILCLRAKYPMEKKGNDWVRSADLEPIQAEDILFEMFVHGWIDHAHKFHRTKISTRSLEPVFPDNEVLTLNTGKRLRAWADGAELEKKTQSGVLSPAQMDELEREGHEAAGGGAAPLDGWKARVRVSFWPKMTKTQRDTITALIPELDTAAKEADKRFEDEPTE